MHKERLLIFTISLPILSILIKDGLHTLLFEIFSGLLFLHLSTSLSFYSSLQTTFSAVYYSPVLAARREGPKLLNPSSIPGLEKSQRMSSSYLFALICSSQNRTKFYSQVRLWEGHFSENGGCWCMGWTDILIMLTIQSYQIFNYFIS